VTSVCRGSELMIGIAVDSLHPVLLHQDRRGASCAGTRAARLGRSRQGGRRDPPGMCLQEALMRDLGFSGASFLSWRLESYSYPARLDYSSVTVYMHLRSSH